jgi:hypothetical protein
MRKVLTSFFVLALLLLGAPIASAESVAITISEPSHRKINGVFVDDELTALLSYEGRLGQLVFNPTRGSRNWFIDPITRMNPNLNFSQVVLGKNNNRGTKSGLIETKDFYFFLDGVRIVSGSKFWSQADEEIFCSWIKEFLTWLIGSDQGISEAQSINNHGIALDLQVYSLASYIGDTDLMYEIFIRSLGRLKAHFSSDGFQPHEMKRTTTAHYSSFNLQLWINYAYLLRNTIGHNLWKKLDLYQEKLGKSVMKNSLKLGVKWLYAMHGNIWKYPQIDEFDSNRQSVIFHLSLADCPFLTSDLKKLPAVEVLPSSLHPHDGAPLWWPLLLKTKFTING